MDAASGLCTLPMPNGHCFGKLTLSDALEPAYSTDRIRPQRSSVMAKCAACDEQAVTFIKGLWLCGGHLRQATERARAGDGRSVMVTGSTIMTTFATRTIAERGSGTTIE